MMYCIGLTGTIASGKSLAMDYFKTQDIDTLSTDQIARTLTQKNTIALTAIGQHFGRRFLSNEGELNRRQLRQHILAHPEDRKWLEQLLHPMIRQRIESAITHFKSPYCVIEIPLLLDRTPYPYLNRILLITSEPKQQIQRLMARDHCSEEEASAFLAHQETDNPRPSIADDIAINTGSKEELYRQLSQLHQQYLQGLKIRLKKS